MKLCLSTIKFDFHVIFWYVIKYHFSLSKDYLKTQKLFLGLGPFRQKYGFDLWVIVYQPLIYNTNKINNSIIVSSRFFGFYGSMVEFLGV